MASTREKRQTTVSKLPLLQDQPSNMDGIQFGDFNYPLLLHDDILNLQPGALSEPVKKRLHLVLQHLAAHGRTSIVKGCKGEENRGWRRSPLGGGHGMHYYLWWAPKGTSQIGFDDLAEKSIVVREIRHHNEHGQLTAGKKGSYLPLDHSLFSDQIAFLTPPWTPDQDRFIYDTSPIRFLIGDPGAGKTTTLWKAIEARTNERVLYLTYSQKLIDYATEHFETFKPKTVEVKSYAFMTLLGEIIGQDVARPTLSQSQATFRQALDNPYIQKVIGPWRKRENGLFAEIRAILFGRAIPGRLNTIELAGSIHRLKDSAYLSLRGRSVDQTEAAKSLLEVVKILEDDSKQFQRFFPELIAAGKSLQKLSSEPPAVPEGLLGFDRVVIDEVQDLTLLEAAVIVELCRVIRHKGEYAPWLLVAGDDGQTVHPSGFDWAELKKLVEKKIDKPSETILDENLRCPTQISKLVERASGFYSDMSKRYRPTNQHSQWSEQTDSALVYHVEVESRESAIALLENLVNLQQFAAISLDDSIQGWLPDKLKDSIMEPADVKGMEYQSVCVINPGKLLNVLMSKDRKMDGLELEEQDHRTKIDRFRVALSRTTETLVFLNITASNEEITASKQFLEEYEDCDPEELIKHLSDEEISTEDRIYSYLLNAVDSLQQKPRRAWERACSAANLLENVTNDDSLHREAYVILLKTAAHILINDIKDGIDRTDVLAKVREIFKTYQSPETARAFEYLNTWCLARTSPPFDLLNAVISLKEDGKWLRDVLPPVFQTLRRAVMNGATSNGLPEMYTQNVEDWLKLTEFPGDVKQEARTLRCESVETLLSLGKLVEAEHIFAHIEPKDPHTAGLLREAQHQYYEAAQEFVLADEPDKALRNFRAAGMWKAALPYATGSDAEDLKWISELDDLLHRRPEGHSGRLTEKEKSELKLLLEKNQEE